MGPPSFHLCLGAHGILVNSSCSSFSLLSRASSVAQMSGPLVKSSADQRRKCEQFMLASLSTENTPADKSLQGGNTSFPEDFALPSTRSMRRRLCINPIVDCDDGFSANFQLPSSRSVRRRLSAQSIDLPRPDAVTATQSRRKRKACMLARSEIVSSSTSHGANASSSTHRRNIYSLHLGS